MKRFEDFEHLLRVAGLFALGLVLFVAMRVLLVPSDFGELGHYRTGALEANRARAVSFAGQAACAECHTDTAALKAQGKHAKVNCEACHGAQAAHARSDDSTASKTPRPDPRALCLTCHAQSVARPAKFPQIDPKEHAESGACTECHTPHDPLGEAKK